MFTKQLYTGCLSEAAYYPKSDRRAAVIGLFYDTGVFLQLEGKKRAATRYTFKTVFPADVVCSDPKLQKATGAPPVFDPGTETGFPIHQVRDASSLKLGYLTIIAGYTPASPCCVLQDKNGKPNLAFTGDTLFATVAGHPGPGGHRDMHVLTNPHSNFYCSTKINIEGYNSLYIYYGKRINRPVCCRV